MSDKSWHRRSLPTHARSRVNVRAIRYVRNWCDGPGNHGLCECRDDLGALLLGQVRIGDETLRGKVSRELQRLTEVGTEVAGRSLL
ncbi:hypothetical protein SAFG77S_01752 [Streptomyces afghaniensis]